MSGAAVLLSELRSQGKTIAVVGTNLRIAPKVTDAVLIERLRAHKAELMALLKEQAEIERIAQLDADRKESDRKARRGYDYGKSAPSRNEYIGRTPAGTLIKTCLEYGIGLRLEADGTLVVASNGKAWRSLIYAIEAHVDEIAALILSEWSPYDA